MKPIAVVYWLEDGKERRKRCYDQETLDEHSVGLRRGKYVHWICMCDEAAIAPPRRRRKAV